MTDTENRLHDLEVRFGDADKRQESFETFVRAYMKNNSEQMQRMEARMDKIDGRMDRIEDRMEAQFKQLDTKIDKVQSDLSAQMHNLLVAGGIGFFTVVVTIFLTK